MRKAKPILFNTPMVQALLEGMKTQTRRIIKPSPSTSPIRNLDGHWYQGIQTGNVEKIKCPFGKVGDLLYVREATEVDFKISDAVFLSKYSADNSPVLYGYDKDAEEYEGVRWNYFKDKRPSIHMKREFSRLTLEITDIRIESLQDISEEDAKAEGFESLILHEDGEDVCVLRSKDVFFETWDALYGQTENEEAPLVWVIEFKVHKCNVDSFKEET
jgi:hypothetical protein